MDALQELKFHFPGKVGSEGQEGPIRAKISWTLLVHFNGCLRRCINGIDYAFSDQNLRIGKVETHNHGQPRYDLAESRAIEARFEEYIRPKRTEDRRSQSYP
jgi:hypothetical protein